MNSVCIACRLLCLAVFVASARHVRADSIFWNNADGGAFNVGSNWQGGGIPGPLDVAVFNLASASGYAVLFDGDVLNDGLRVPRDIVSFHLGGFTYTLTSTLTVGDQSTGALEVRGGTLATDSHVTLGGPQGAIGALTVTGTDSGALFEGFWVGDLGDGTLVVEDGGSLVSGGTLLGRVAGAVGRITIDGEGSTWTNTDFVAIGENGDGVLEVRSGGGVDVAVVCVIGAWPGSSGDVLVTGSNSMLSAGPLGIGARSHGTLTIDGGGAVSSAWSQIGGATGGTGTVVVRGPVSRWTNTDFLDVGLNGEGTLRLEDGGSLTSAHVSLGNNVERLLSETTVTGSGSNLNVTGSLWIGNVGLGALLTEDGGSVAAQDAVVGSQPGSAGSATISGVGAHWDIASAANVGWAGTGTLMISGGGMLTSGAPTHIGSQPGAHGTTTVTGNGSQWTHSDHIILGAEGNGTLRVENGGAVSGSWCHFAEGEAAQGLLVVDGVGSSLSMTFQLNIGVRGRGDLQVLNGATISNSWCRIGDWASAEGVATVSGPGSTWTCSEWANIANAGRASLTVTDEAEFSASTVSVGSAAGGSGTLTVSNGGQTHSPTLTVFQGSRLQGDGTVHSTVTNRGTVAPGVSAGAMTVDGDYAQSETGVLSIEIGGTAPGADHDQLVVTGGATLDGALHIELINGFTPQPGDVFEIMTFASRSATFAEFFCIQLPGGSVLAIRYSDTGVTLEVAPACGGTCYDLSADCDGDGIPDACEIADCTPGDPACNDCNNNGVPDICDVPMSAGCPDGHCTQNCSQDANEDCVPDECIAWDGETGSDLWSEPLNWDQDIVPDNMPGSPGPQQTFAVDIPGSMSVVTLDIQAEIDSLRLLDGASLDITLGDLTMETTNGILNNGDMTIGDDHAIIAAAPDGAVPITGDSAVTLAGATAALSSASAANLLTNSTSIIGEGMIDAAFVNQTNGTVDANALDATLTVTGSNTKVNNGAFRATAGGTLLVHETSVTGIGIYEADGGVLSLAPGAGTVSVTGVNMSITNGGRGHVDGAALINMFGLLAIDTCGAYQAAPEAIGGVSARLTADQVQISETIPGSGGAMMLADSMSVDVATTVTIQGTAPGWPFGGCTPPRLGLENAAAMQAGSLSIIDGAAVELADSATMVIENDLLMAIDPGCLGLNLGGCTPPRLHAMSASQVNIGGDLFIPAIADITVTVPFEPASPLMTLAGDFVNESTDPTMFGWENGPLTLNGNGVPQTFEVAGQDLGTVPDGLASNFAMGTIDVSSGTIVAFVDVLDNDSGGQAPCTEALYVKDLILRAGSTVTVTDTTVYYETITDEGATVKLLGCGQLLFVCGDPTGDCQVTLDDFETFQSCFTGADSGPIADGCAQADFDHDGDIDFVDFGQLQLIFDGGNN